MPRVIGHDKSAEKECTCEHCGARVAYLPKDVKERNGRDYTGGSDGERYIRCPKCNKKIILDSW